MVQFPCYIEYNKYMYSDTRREVKLSLISLHRTGDYTSITIGTNITTTVLIRKSNILVKQDK
jgi:hypothetical protein